MKDKYLSTEEIIQRLREMARWMKKNPTWTKEGEVVQEAARLLEELPKGMN